MSIDLEPLQQKNNWPDEIKKAFDVLWAAHSTASDLLALFDKPGGKPRLQGTPTNTEGDLLRSMLIFAGAGLDSATKQLIRSILPKLEEKDEEVRKKCIEHFSNSDTKTVIQWLFEASPKDAILEKLADDLTSNSLQSVRQIYIICTYLHLDPKKISKIEIMRKL